MRSSQLRAEGPGRFLLILLRVLPQLPRAVGALHRQVHSLQSDQPSLNVMLFYRWWRQDRVGIPWATLCAVSFGPAT